MNSLLHKNSPASKPAILHGNSKPVVQPKLTVNTPGDIYEQEADAMANRIMRISSNETVKPVTGLIGKSLQRKCSHCEEEERKRRPVMRKAEAGNSGMSVSSSFASSLNTSKGGGSPLPQATRSFMENAFSSDFSSVRIHTGSQASEMSKGINAKAFTTGNDIYFKSGEYSPNSKDGKKLLAHELTHVVQQGNGIGRKIQRFGDLTKVPSMACDVAVSGSGGTEAISSLFTTSSTLLSQEQRDEIAAYVETWLASGGTDALRVDGYASTPGSDEMNWELSCSRALSVANELRDNGVPDTMIEIFAQGETSEFGGQGENQRAVITSIAAPLPTTIHFRSAALTFLTCAPCNPYTDDGAIALSPPATEPGSGFRMKHFLDGSIVADSGGRRILSSSLANGRTIGVTGYCGTSGSGHIITHSASGPISISPGTHGEGVEFQSVFESRLGATVPSTIPGSPCGFLGTHTLIPAIKSEFFIRMFADGTKESGFISASTFPFHYLYDDRSLKIHGGVPVSPLVDFVSWATSTGTPLAAAELGFKALRLKCCGSPIFGLCPTICASGFSVPTGLSIGGMASCATMVATIGSMACPATCSPVGSSCSTRSRPANP